ncbi:unnamed protein product, partial [Scytosiphon promiscuus]
VGGWGTRLGRGHGARLASRRRCRRQQRGAGRRSGRGGRRAEIVSSGVAYRAGGGGHGAGGVDGAAVERGAWDTVDFFATGARRACAAAEGRGARWRWQTRCLNNSGACVGNRHGTENDEEGSGGGGGGGGGGYKSDGYFGCFPVFSISCVLVS